MTVLSNMPAKGNWEVSGEGKREGKREWARLAFQPTPPMAAYLVALAVLDSDAMFLHKTNGTIRGFASNFPRYFL